MYDIHSIVHHFFNFYFFKNYLSLFHIFHPYSFHFDSLFYFSFLFFSTLHERILVCWRIHVACNQCKGFSIFTTCQDNMSCDQNPIPIENRVSLDEIFPNGNWISVATSERQGMMVQRGDDWQKWSVGGIVSVLIKEFFWFSDN